MKFRRAWIALGIFVLAVLIPLGVYYYVTQPGTGPTTTPPLQTVTDQQLTATKLEQTRRWFAPWHLAKPGTTGAPRLVMLLQGGGVDVSSWHLSADASWTNATLIQLVGATRQGSRIRLKLDDGRVYDVSLGQPFVLQRFPQQVLAFRSNGGQAFKLVSIPTSRAHQLGNKER